MAEGISIGGRPAGGDGAAGAPAPWEGIPSEPGAPAIVDLTAYGEQLLVRARADARGKASAPVLKSERQRALLVALTAGAGLAEHASPPAASLQVLSGRFRLHVPGTGDEWVCGVGDLVAIPQERHAVDCVEDGVFLLTVTPPSRD
jgi:quercetin dioxygenase-like cupin family protein